MKKLYLLAYALLGFALIGCSSQEIVDEAAETFIPADVREEARNLAALLVAKDSAGLRPYIHETLETADFDSQLADVLALVPGGEVVDISLASANQHIYVRGDGNITDYSFQYQYELEQGWLMVGLVLREEAGTRALINIHLTPLEGDLREIHSLNLLRASMSQWVWFCLLILNVAFILFTFVRAFRIRKSLKRPKRWLAFILVGVGSLSMNWTTGMTTFSLLSFGFLGGGLLTSGPHTPWIISLYFPLGAALFWFFKSAGKLGLREEGAEQEAPSSI